MTDDPRLALKRFAIDLTVHAHRTGTRPWLILPDASAKLRARPANHLVLLCADQPAAAVTLDNRVSSRVDNNLTEDASLIVDIVDGFWTLTAYQPSIRKAGMLRVLYDISSQDVPLSENHIPVPRIYDPEELGAAIRDLFWNNINPQLSNPFSAGAGDPVSRHQPLTWLRGNEENLSNLIQQIAWADDRIPDLAYPFDVVIQAASDDAKSAILINPGHLQDNVAHVSRALQENVPAGWKSVIRGENPLPRHSDYRQEPIRLDLTIRAPSYHDRVAAASSITAWLQLAS